MVTRINSTEVKDRSNDIMAKKAILVDLVDYQKSSAVSRTILDQHEGTVTIFAFDEGEGLSEHTAPYDALVHILDGEADVIISGTTRRLLQGEVIIMPANQPDSLKATKRFKMMLIMIRSPEK